MIFRCNYEELQALKSGARAALEADSDAGGTVIAPPSVRVQLERLLPRLDGDLVVSTLEEQRSLEVALVAATEALLAEMNTSVLATHPASDTAVAAYFDYAHALTALDRIRAMGQEMVAVIELLAGGRVTEELASTFVFPD